MYLNLAIQLEKNNYIRFMRLGVAYVYMITSADCNPYHSLIFSLTELANLFDETDFFDH